MNSRNSDVSSQETECGLIAEVCEYAASEHARRQADACEIARLRARLCAVESAARAVFEGRMYPGEWRNPEVPVGLMDALGEALGEALV